MVPKKPRTKRERNIHGDFVVTKIRIKDDKPELPPDMEDEEESEEESEEEPAKADEPEEEVKKAPVKVLSKKE